MKVLWCLESALDLLLSSKKKKKKQLATGLLFAFWPRQMTIIDLSVSSSHRGWYDAHCRRWIRGPFLPTLSRWRGFVLQSCRQQVIRGDLVTQKNASLNDRLAKSTPLLDDIRQRGAIHHLYELWRFFLVGKYNKHFKHTPLELFCGPENLNDYHIAQNAVEYL